MRKTVVLAGAMMLGGSAILGAQAQSSASAQCGAGLAQDACQKAVDLYNYMSPQLGTVIAGGNATLGQGGTLGGLGHFAIGIRANALAGSLPEVENVQPSIGGAERTSFTTKDQILGLPTVDAAIGIFKGIPLGVTNVGGIDLLASAFYLPEYSGSGVEVAVPDGSFKFGYGARLGLLQESLITPGVSVTYFVRDLPTVDIAASAGNAELDVNQLEVSTKAWRVTASKNFMLFGLAAGVGQDTYESSANVRATQSGVSTSVAVGQEVKRTNYFADLYFNILLAKLVAEVGMVSGGDVQTFNSFDTPADDNRLYGSVGLRIGF